MSKSIQQALAKLPVGSSFFVENAKVGDAQYQKVMRAARKGGMRIQCWWVEQDEIYFRPGLRFKRLEDKTDATVDQSTKP